MKRTTLILDVSLYRELKRRAAEDGRTLAETVERTLRAGLKAAVARRHARLEVPSYDLGPFLVDPGERGSTTGPRPGTAEGA